MLVAYCVFNIAWLFVWNHYVKREISLTYTMFVRDMLPYMVLSVFVMSATYAMTYWIGNVYLLLISRILIAAVLYTSIAWVMRSDELAEIVAFLFKHKK